MVDICIECEKEVVANNGSEYCLSCSEAIMKEWQQERKNQESEYYNSRL